MRLATCGPLPGAWDFAGAIVLGDPAGLSKGAGTINIPGPYYINGAQISCASLAASAASCGTDATNAGNITAGVLGAAEGGKGVASPTAHTIPINEGASAEANTGTMAAGKILVGQGVTADPAAETVSGDATLAAGGALTVTKTGGVAVGPGATGLGIYAVTVTGVDLHTATGDVAHFALPAGVNDFALAGNQSAPTVWGCSATSGSVTWALWSAPTGGGTSLAASATATTFGGASGTAATIIAAAANWVAGHDVYLNVTAANASALTCNVTVFYKQLG